MQNAQASGWEHVSFDALVNAWTVASCGHFAAAAAIAVGVYRRLDSLWGGCPAGCTWAPSKQLLGQL